MVRHKDVQNPEDYQGSDYHEFRSKLFSDDTPLSELEEICMTLAHLPTKTAQNLLLDFQSSDRASEVCWLQCAVDEGQFHYLSPVSKTERRDLIALKLYYKNEEMVVDQMGKRTTYEYNLEQMQIELDAVSKLIQKTVSKADKEELEIKASALQGIMCWEESRLVETLSVIQLTEKINQEIKESITTSKYANLNYMEVNEIKFDGEEW